MFYVTVVGVFKVNNSPIYYTVCDYCARISDIKDVIDRCVENCINNIANDYGNVGFRIESISHNVVKL